ncbi:uncharacterized protein I303_106583 [Kwoniella dejecticola CBS 10117]|uniref:Uncharacterized protein n=1 Tax=Kwoniella dejecticola CBS 10117 TaxID=1296121 RepID=A0A1A5ZUB2_9TREE|nr:uncharacterized protein I303_08160 [Kwoniella dejecticola CBS 10117]OBR81390.1 hypothetical protein I303_08160 [Kwoniella dejecticola CBS 10117]
MSTSNLKARHYSALSSRLKHLQYNLSETETQLELMSDQLKSMARLGVGCGSQFMAVSRLLDIELMQATQESTSYQHQQQQQQNQNQSLNQNQSQSQQAEEGNSTP